MPGFLAEIRNLDFEWSRRLYHMTPGILTFIINRYTSVTVKQVLISLIPFDIVYIGSDILRRLFPEALNPKFCKIMSPILRRKEKDPKVLTSSSWYQIGITLSLMFARREIAILSILILAFADPAASFCGRLWQLWSQKPSDRKSLVGSFAALLVASMISFFMFSGGFKMGPDATECVSKHNLVHKILTSLVIGLLASIFEFSSSLIPLLDDNIVIPISMTVALSYVSYLRDLCCAS